MTVTNIEEARKSPVLMVERRLAEINERMAEIREQQTALTKEGNELFRWRGELEAALATLKKLVESNA